MLLWLNYRIRVYTGQRIGLEKETIAFFLVVQKLLTNVLSPAELWNFFPLCATFTFDSLVKWIDILIHSLFHSKSKKISA